MPFQVLKGIKGNQHFLFVQILSHIFLFVLILFLGHIVNKVDEKC